MLRDLRHLWQFGHLPQWDAFKGIAFCWRCVKGPGRNGRIRVPVVIRRAIAAALAITVLMASPIVLAAATDPRYNALEARVTSLEARVSALEAAWITPSPSPAPTPTATSLPPTPSPSPVPTLSPSPSPVPSPTPQPQPRRFSAPTTTQTITIPTSIDSTGATDVSAAVQSWVNSVPNGSILSFRPGTYRLAGDGILLDGRSNLIFEGNGATLKTFGSGTRDSGFVLGWGTVGNSHITIRNFTIDNDNPDGATGNAYHAGQESSEGLLIWRAESYIEFANNTVTDTWGHCVYMSANGGPASPDHVWIHDNACSRLGVMGIAIASVTDAWIEGNTINDTAIYPVDFEDGQAGQPMVRVYVGQNQLNRWGWNSYYTGHVIDANGSTGMTWQDVTIDGNTATGGFQSSPQNGQGGQISFMGGDTKQGLRITNNTMRSGSGPTVTIANGPGAVVSGNTP